MATDLEKLVVQLSADFRQFEKSMAKASDVTNRQFNAIERRARQMNKNLDNIFKSTASRLTAPLAGIGAALGAAELKRLTDVWTDLTSRVNLAAGSMEKGQEVMGRIGEMARRTYSSLEQTAESYISNATALKELGYTTNDQLDYTEALNNALVISAAKGDRAAAIQNALAKAMAGGKLAGDDLNTVIQQGGRVAEALAAGLGVGVNQLRALGAQGKITSREVFKALTSQMQTLRKEAEEMPATISDGVQLLQNALLEYVGNADKATGVSRNISDALVIMADNFDTTADVALQLAGVIAGALIGRSLLGMIRTLGIAGTALTSFTRALAAARTMAGLTAAFGGLSAAAGPVGMVIGGAVVASLVTMASASAEATARSEKLTAEFERMGLLAKKASEGADEAANSLDKMTDIERIRKIREINEELKRLKSGGGTLFGSQGDEFNSIIASAAKAEGMFGGLFSGTTSKMRANNNATLAEIARIAAAVRDGDMAANTALDTLKVLEQVDVSQPVLDLIEQLKNSVQYFRAAEIAAAQLGDTTAIDELKASLAAARDELSTIAEIHAISPKQLREIDEIIAGFDGTRESAGKARDALAKVADTLPSAGPYIRVIASIVEKLGALQSAAAAAREEAAGVLAMNSAAAYRASENASMDALASMEATNKAFIDSQTKRNALSKEQLAIETEIATVRKEAAAAGATLTEKQIRDIATGRVGANERRSKEGKKPKAEPKTADDRFDNLTQSINDRVAAMRLEQEMLGATFKEQQRRAVALDLEQEALRQVREEARKKGEQDWQNAQLSPEQRKEIDKVSEAYARQADDLRKAQEAQQLNRDLLKGAFGDLRSALEDGKLDWRDLGDIAMNALDKIIDKIENDLIDAILQANSTADGSGGGGLFGWLSKGLGVLLGGGVGSAGGDPWAGKRLAGGGAVSGPGGPTDDKVPAMLSNGEFVVNAAATKRNRALLEAINRGGLLKLAAGGAVEMPKLQAPTMPPMEQIRSMASMTYAPSLSISAPNAQPGVREEIAAAGKQLLDQMRREFTPNVMKSLRQMKVQGLG